jgi:hypothetical protein
MIHNSMIAHSFTTYNLANAVCLIITTSALEYSIRCLLAHNQNHPNAHVKGPSHLSIFYLSRLIIIKK